MKSIYYIKKCGICFFMNEVEKRRMELLEQTRHQYGASYNPPAVHPRYQAAFASTAKGDEVMSGKNTWVFRCVVAILIFSLFYLMDTRNEQIGTVDSKRIVQEVQRDLLSK